MARARRNQISISEVRRDADNLGHCLKRTSAAHVGVVANQNARAGHICQHINCARGRAATDQDVIAKPAGQRICALIGRVHFRRSVILNNPIRAQRCLAKVANDHVRAAAASDAIALTTAHQNVIAAMAVDRILTVGQI